MHVRITNLHRYVEVRNEDAWPASDGLTGNSAVRRPADGYMQFKGPIMHAAS